jgi:para-nitrobenzyl esterase
MNRRNLIKQSTLCAAAILVRPALGRIAGMQAEPEAVLTTGRVRGYLENGVRVFKGIPYGADTSVRRFMAPVAPSPWTGVRSAVAFGPRAPQMVDHHHAQTAYHLPPETGPISEDCLHLNVWSAGGRDGRKRPVMVYIHGGAYSSGSANSALYDGTSLCRRGDVVVVTLNHRLNLFGFLYLAQIASGFPDSGNAGMLDLILALSWVRNNIEEFGGDPQRILIFGQSGGGAKCATLMAMPAAHGLFHRVLTMSGEQVTASRMTSATDRSLAVLRALDLPSGRVQDLRILPMQRLLQATLAAGYYGPVRDLRNLVHDPFDPTAPRLSQEIPLVLGNTHDETRLLIGGSDPTAFVLTWRALPAKLSAHSHFLNPLSPKDAIAKYRRMYPDGSPSDIFFAITTAFRSWRGQLIEAERRAVQPAGAAPTWVYQLDWRTPVDGGKWGAPHTLDIPLSFGTVRVADAMTGDGVEARRLAATMCEAWIAFAASGDPNRPGIPNWPPYNLANRSTLLWDTRVRVDGDPRSAERRLVEQVPYTQPGT